MHSRRNLHYTYFNIKKLILLALTFAVLSKGISQTIPDELKKVVIFIFIKNNNDNIVANGTGFFISIQDSAHDRNFIYLITKKHVVQDKLKKEFYDKIYVRINKRSFSFDTIPLDLIVQKRIQQFVIHQDPSIDLVVIPLAPDISKYNYLSIPENMFFSSKKEFDSSYMKEGTNVFYSGLFSPYTGYISNNPIIRFGRVAMLPRENILWDSTSLRQDLFLVETTTYGGNSGSPLFCYNSPLTIEGSMTISPKPIKLAGIVQGYSGEKTQVEYVQSSMNLMYTSNVGITAVVPSYLLYEILEGKILSNVRKSTK